MFYAVGTGNAEIAKLLIKHRADVNAKTKDGLTPLMTAESENQRVIVKLLENYKQWIPPSAEADGSSSRLESGLKE